MSDWRSKRRPSDLNIPRSRKPPGHLTSIDVNGSVWEHTFEMNQTWDCAERSGEGVTAGQFGTWFIDRGSWCPGGQVGANL